MKQLEPPFTRLDRALDGKHIEVGSRFVYTINGSGTCHEGMLQEVSPLGHVKLDDSGVWHWPPEIVIEEILSSVVNPVPGAPPQKLPEPWAPQEERPTSKKKK